MIVPAAFKKETMCSISEVTPGMQIIRSPIINILVLSKNEKYSLFAFSFDLLSSKTN
jgi:hypothetical protein